MSDQISLKEWVENFKSGAYSSPDVSTQIAAGWYDWFCKDTSLARKTQNLAPKVVQLCASPKINVDTNYVFFKNNCPMCGPLYDSFSFCDRETGDVKYWVTVRSGHTGKAEVYGSENDFQEPLAEGTWKDIKKFFEV